MMISHMLALLYPPCLDPFCITPPLLVGAIGLLSEKTRLGRELSGALVATLAGNTYQHLEGWRRG